MEVDVNAAPFAELTLNEIVQSHPATLQLFSRYGMDTCCGGGLPLREAAARHNVPLQQLLHELDEGMAAPAA
jgi:regulator of cell morphogenesis and NO signaling